MTEIGSVTKLLEERQTTFNKHTIDMISKFEDRLTPAFQKVFSAPDKKIVWTGVEPLIGTTKAVMVSGLMQLEIGDIVSIGDKKITIDESNVNEYNKFVRFAFPIIMLELATIDELYNHMNRYSKIGSAIEVTAEKLGSMMHKCALAYEESVLNDPEKVAVLDTATKPTSILGFAVTDLTDEQIRNLKYYENQKSGRLN